MEVVYLGNDPRKHGRGVESEEGKGREPVVGARPAGNSGRLYTTDVRVSIMKSGGTGCLPHLLSSHWLSFARRRHKFPSTSCLPYRRLSEPLLVRKIPRVVGAWNWKPEKQTQ